MPKSKLIQDIEILIGKPLIKVDLIAESLVHRSYLNESTAKHLSSNERLEFLGDSIVQMWVSHTIYDHFPDFDEGKLTAIRTHLVRTETLALLSNKLNLGNYLQLSKGEEKDNGRHSQLLLANCFEALSAAIFISNGQEAIHNFFDHLFIPLIQDIKDPSLLKDSKSLLQEKVQIHKQLPPKYVVTNSVGPDHHRLFTVVVQIDDKDVGEGKGTSKQEAEEQAAKSALVKLGIKR